MFMYVYILVTDILLHITFTFTLHDIMIWADRTWAPRGALCGENQEEKKRAPKNTDLQFRDWIDWISPFMNLDIFRYLDIKL